MKRMLLAVVAGVCLLSGCRTVTNGVQPTASTPYQKAATVMLNFATDVQSAQLLEINLYQGGLIDKPTHNAIENSFKQVGNYGTQIDALIAAQASASTIQDRVNAALNSLKSITAQTGKLDPTQMARFTASVQAIELLFNTVITQFNVTTSEVYFGPNDNRSVGRARSVSRSSDLQPNQIATGSNGEAIGGYHRGRRCEVRADQPDCGRRNSEALAT